MSFFSRIGKIFGDKESRKLALSDALETVDSQRNEKLASATDESYKTSLQIYSEIQVLRGMLSNFLKVKLEDRRTETSGKVKDRFCIAAEKQLSILEKPEKDMEKVRAFAAATEKTLSSLGGLTPQQMMHIGFFFKGDVSAISRKVTAINELVQKIQSSAEDLRKYDKIEELKNEINSLETRIDSLEKEKRLLEAELAKLRENMQQIDSEIANIDLGSLNKAEKSVADAELKKNIVEQDLLFYVSIDKMLKKLKYNKKINDEALEAYIRSPSAAIISDSKGKIFSFAEQLIELSGNRAMEMDEKGAVKLRQLLDNRHHVEEKRMELLELIANLESRKKEFGMARGSVDEKKRSLENSKSSLERQMNSSNRELEKMGSELKAKKNSLESRRIEIKMMAEHLTNSEIE